ncbi:MAG TPA: SRPBCC family protein [Pseudonocardia sp.]|nr:SRPBCC family protein [Pseudonocardia sp.]
MNRRTELTVAVDVDAPAGTSWQTLTDWPAQGEWMLGTTVRVIGGGAGRHAGARLHAVTGVGPIGIPDTMELVEWDPPRRCVVQHTGKIVRGAGVFEVVELGPQRSQIVWTELLELPLGVLGRLGWPVVRPLFRLGVRVSLDRLARRCAAAHRVGRA